MATSKGDVVLRLGVDDAAVGPSLARTEGHFRKLGQAAEQAAQQAGLSWREFVAQRMGPYMKELGSHGAAIRKIGAEWQAYKASGSAALGSIGQQVSATTTQVAKLGAAAHTAAPAMRGFGAVVKDYYRGEMGQGRAGRFLAAQIGELIPVSKGAAGAIGQLVSGFAFGGGLGAGVEVVKMLAGAFREHKRAAEEAAKAAKEWAVEQSAALAKVTQGFRDLAVAQASAGMGSAAQLYVSKRQEILGTEEKPGLNAAKIEAIDARAAVDEAKAEAARFRELAKQPRGGPRIGALVDYESLALGASNRARELETAARLAEQKAADFQARLDRLEHDYRNTGRTLDALAQEDKEREERARAAAAAATKGAAADAKRWSGGGPESMLPRAADFALSPDAYLAPMSGGSPWSFDATRAAAGERLGSIKDLDKTGTNPVVDGVLGDARQWDAALAERQAMIDGFASATKSAVEGTLGDTLVSAMDGNFDRIGDMWGDLLKRMAAQAIASSFLSLLTGGGGGILGALFGGGGPVQLGGPRANGGPVTAGKMYLVGERGPEPFIPSTSGTILPTESLQGGRSVNVTLNVSAMDAGSFSDFMVGHGKTALIKTLTELAADGR